MHDESFLEAVYLASPVLYDECVKLRSGEIRKPKDIAKIRASLIKYYERMFSRCTPFGLFSGCTVSEWSDAPTAVIYREEDMQRHTRLDMHYLCALSQRLDSLPALRARLHYFPNSSIYRLADEFRYVEYRYENGRRIHQISSVMASEYLETVLEKAAGGLTVKAICDLLVDAAEVTAEEALEFTNDLLAAQVLVSELEPAITGKEFLHQVVDTLDGLDAGDEPSIAQLLALLRSAIADIDALDSHPVNPVSAYRAILEKLKPLEVPIEENRLFQVDLFRQPAVSHINTGIQADLLDCMNLLKSLRSRPVQEDLKKFAEKFADRYENRRLPLLQVLDTETGIGYPADGGRDITPLVDGLMVPAGEDSGALNIKWDVVQERLFKKLSGAAKEQAYEVEMNEDDWKDMDLNWKSAPPSMSVMFRLGEGGMVLLDGISGSSAANLLGRFAHGDERIHSIVNGITAREQELNPEIVFAEIVHLPESRIGNVLLHPAFRNFEIPFLARSSLPAAQQLRLQDLEVSVTGGEIRLFHAPSGKVIIPRLSTAHNYSMGALPVYQFLCDLQLQHLTGSLGFHWGSMASQFSFLPRVRYKRIVLHEATWQLSAGELAPVLKREAGEPVEKLRPFLEKWRMPRYMVLAEGDNELLLDWENAHSIASFIKTIRERPSVTLKEFLGASPCGIGNEAGGFYINQFVAALVRQDSTYTGHTRTGAEQGIARSFPPGSEWLYYKIYCGTGTIDGLLTDMVQPITGTLNAGGLIDQWFFLRYADPNPHLRLRLHLPRAATDTGKVMAAFAAAFDAASDAGRAWKFQLDTYQRELERYGRATMDISERFFYADSHHQLQFLSGTEGDERENLRWQWAIRLLHEWMEAFGLDLKGKCALMEKLKEGYSLEFNRNEMLHQQLSKRYATHRNTVKLMLELAPDQEHEWQGLVQVAAGFGKAILPLVAELDRILPAGPAGMAERERLLTSYMHMSMCRLVLSQLRLHELVLYETLYRYYHAQLKIIEQKEKYGRQQPG